MGVLALILAGGEGSRLSILGEKRAKPAIPFGGKYRIIDFPLPNAVSLSRRTSKSRSMMAPPE